MFMKKFKELVNSPKVLWSIILGMFIASIFVILLPIGLPFFPCFFAAAILMISQKGNPAPDPEKPSKANWSFYDYSTPIAVIIGGLIIQILYSIRLMI